MVPWNIMKLILKSEKPKRLMRLIVYKDSFKLANSQEWRSVEASHESYGLKLFGLMCIV